MANIRLHGSDFRTAGALPAPGQPAPDFVLVDQDMNDVRLADFAGRRVLLAIVPSLDTPTCALSARKLDLLAASLTDTEVLLVSADLPFAQGRVVVGDSISRARALSLMRDPGFARRYGVLIEDGPLAGLCARAIVVIDEVGAVRYSELVTELCEEPDYQAALGALAA